MPIRLGIIGAGAAVRVLHAPVLAAIRRQIVPIAVAARTRSSAETCAALAGARLVFTDYRELLAHGDVDAVLIAVPIECNGQVLVDAAKSGKHILAEKPLAATVADAIVAVNACRAARSVVVIAENFLYRKDIATAKELLNRGELGEVFAFRVASVFDLHADHRRVWTDANWRRSAPHTGGFVLDAGVHAVSAMRHLLGEVTEVAAMTLDRSPLLRGPDSLLMQMTMASGASGQYFATYTAMPVEERLFDLELLCAGGALTLRPGRVVCRTGNTVRSFGISAAERGYRRLWLNFCAAVRGDEPALATPEKCFGDVAVIEAGLESARTGLRQPVIQLGSVAQAQAV